jgi:transcriptional regulator with XRE-family HTH domain
MQRNTRARFGDRVKALRLESGMTQEDLSEKAGIGRVFISQLENGHKEACLDVMEALAGSFKITISDLLSGV